MNQNATLEVQQAALAQIKLEIATQRALERDLKKQAAAAAKAKVKEDKLARKLVIKEIRELIKTYGLKNQLQEVFFPEPAVEAEVETV